MRKYMEEEERVERRKRQSFENTNIIKDSDL